MFPAWLIALVRCNGVFDKLKLLLLLVRLIWAGSPTLKFSIIISFGDGVCLSDDDEARGIVKGGIFVDEGRDIDVALEDEDNEEDDEEDEEDDIEEEDDDDEDGVGE